MSLHLRATALSCLFASVAVLAQSESGSIVAPSSAMSTSTAASSPTPSPFHITLSSTAVMVIAICITVGVLAIIFASYLCCCSASARRRAAAHARQIQLQNRLRVGVPGDMESGNAPAHDTLGYGGYQYRSSIAKGSDLGKASKMDDADAYEARSMTTKSDSPPTYEA
ncbi:hypothetical protein HMN09_00567500 [Mycena chlorophos]|uniref:Uncharacterized protein n=1 Tax=Mycena chlorophos TaxID=658473 RepID=A0A8H6TAT5_MYCCL|nr:hypothetical protein HMN09_00567500 [Mycena chlorophos]